MPSRHLVDPQIAPLLAQMPGLALDAVRLAETRAAMAAMRAAAPAPKPEDIKVYEETIPGRDGAPDVRLLDLRAEGRPARTTPASCTCTAAAMCWARPT